MSDDNQNSPEFDEQKQLKPTGISGIKQKENEKDTQSLIINSDEVKPYNPFIRNKWWWIKKNILTKSVNSWLMLIITGFLAFYSYQLFKSAAEQNRNSADAVEVAKKALTFQRESDSINRKDQKFKDSIIFNTQYARDSLNYESFLLENRAYVIINPPLINKLRFNGRGNTIKIRIKNVGKTPSQYTQIFMWNDYRKEAIQQAFIDTYKEAITNKFGGHIVGSNDSLDINYQFTRNYNKMDSIYLSKDNLIYIGGIIGYFDIFKNHRMTYFCFQYSHLKHEIAPYKGYNEIR